MKSVAAQTSPAHLDAQQDAAPPGVTGTLLGERSMQTDILGGDQEGLGAIVTRCAKAMDYDEASVQHMCADASEQVPGTAATSQENTEVQRLCQRSAELEERVAGMESERMAHEAQMLSLWEQVQEAQQMLDRHAKEHGAALMDKEGELIKLRDQLSEAVQAAGVELAAVHEAEVKSLCTQLNELRQVLDSQAETHKAALAAKDLELKEACNQAAKISTSERSEGAANKVSEAQEQGQGMDTEAVAARSGRILSSRLQLPDRDLLEERAKRSRLEMEFELYQSQVLKDKQKREGDRIAVEV